MKKKNLEKAIILGLILSTGVYGTVWADAVGISADGTVTQLLESYKHGGLSINHNYPELGDNALAEYEKVEITVGNDAKDSFNGIILDGYTIKAYKEKDGERHYTDFEITLSNNTQSGSGIYLSNNAAGSDKIPVHLEIGNYTAHIYSPNSNAFTMSEDCYNVIEPESIAIINENFNADVVNGNGIVVAAPKSENVKENSNNFTVKGLTNITISGKSVELTDNLYSVSLDHEDPGSSNTQPSKAIYNPAAVYAGDISPYFEWKGTTAEIFDIVVPNLGEGKYGTETKGKSVVNLIGKTTISINDADDEKAYGIFAGKNGEVNVNDVEIITHNKNSIGIAAQNGNLVYDGSLYLNLWGSFYQVTDTVLDTSANKYGSVVTMNGENNTITMAGGGKALYADAKNKADGDEDVIIQSGASGIGTLDVKGDIVAANSGKINLQVNDWADITGDVEATNSAEINFTLQPEAMMIVSDTDNNIIGNSGVSTLSLAKNGDVAGGNVQAANGAIINFNLGNGAYFEGRVDDYKDADNTNWNTIDRNLFDSAFVTENTDENGKMTSGKVNMELGNGAVWNVTEQSWVTNLSGNGTVVLVGEVNQNDENLESNIYTEGTGGYAVHIGKLEGNNTFVVNLNPDNYASSDMIYIYDGSSAGTQNLRINNEQEVLNALQNDGDRIRFATAAKTATTEGAGFGDDYVVRGRGVINSGFSIDYVDYATDTDNGNYNGTAGAVKPGDEYIENTYGAVADSQNLYLVRDSSKDAGLSDSGKTVINMSRANYKNAVYMDRLNKRLGEARYFNNEEEQGMWVRLRHDRIGLDGEFRSQNTMYEMGYDVKQDCDNGERRVGMAIDYMDGSTSYSNIIGEGETKRYGLWLYDTWLGDKGHYTDYVLKWGHLDNDFDIRDKDSLVDITGDYSNNVFSASAEYGKKNDMGGGWYFEPQAQLQFARVTGADYVTSQDTKVSLDGINSLIGRAGFRLGRDLNENSTVYIKADLLHEFLGDQDITATDITGTLREEYENEGTWYDVGFGFATALSNNSYAFMDFEKSFGNDNDETYQINAGVQWTF